MSLIGLQSTVKPCTKTKEVRWGILVVGVTLTLPSICESLGSILALQRQQQQEHTHFLCVSLS